MLPEMALANNTVRSFRNFSCNATFEYFHLTSLVPPVEIVASLRFWGSLSDRTWWFFLRCFLFVLSKDLTLFFFGLRVVVVASMPGFRTKATA